MKIYSGSTPSLTSSLILCVLNSKNREFYHMGPWTKAEKEEHAKPCTQGRETYRLPSLISKVTIINALIPKYITIKPGILKFCIFTTLNSLPYKLPKNHRRRYYHVHDDLADCYHDQMRVCVYLSVYWEGPLMQKIIESVRIYCCECQPIQQKRTNQTE